MRRWLVLLMVLLLPLRAAAGDFMSIGMGLADQKSTVAAGMSPDCPMHQASADNAPAPDDPTAPTSASECGSCALCFPVAEVASTIIVGADRLADAHPALGDGRYLSATARGLLRPPKS